MNRGIHPVEEPHLIGLQPQPAAAFLQVLHHDLPQPVVLGVNGDLFTAETSQCLCHQRTGANGVLVEVQPQHLAATLQRSAVGRQRLHSRPRCRGSSGGEATLSLAHMRSRVEIPSSPSPSLRVSAVKRHKANRDESASGSAFSTGTWS